MRILIVEDDERLRGILVRGLSEAAYAVDAVSNGEEAVRQIKINEYDAMVLDVRLPGMSGFDVCRAARERGVQTPILMLTARDEVADKIEGLDSGADDYLTKPFDFGELLARLRALLRRAPELLASEIRVADLLIDTRAQSVRRGGELIRLTAKEYALLEYLGRNVDSVVSRSDLVAHVWDDNHDPFSNAIEVHINRLRQKIDAGRTPLIHTRRGAGYMLSDQTA